MTTPLRGQALRTLDPAGTGLVFDQVAAVAPLPDGRLVVLDGVARLLMIADPAAGRVDTVRARGEGPDEYRLPTRLLSDGDSVLAVDAGNAKLVRVTADAKLRFVLSLVDLSREGGGLLVPRGMAADGSLYASARTRRSGTDDLLRLSPDGPARSPSTVTILEETLPATARSRSSSGTFARRLRAFRGGDGWAVAHDNSVLVVRAAPYRAEWFRPDGTSISGPPLPTRQVAVTDRDREVWLEGLNRVSEGASTSFGGGGAGRPSARVREDDVDWPETKPPFVRQSPRVDPRGRGWIQGYVSADADPEYDVVDAAGRLAFRVRLAPDQRVVGFSAGIVWIAERINEFGQEEVLSAPLP